MKIEFQIRSFTESSVYFGGKGTRGYNTMGTPQMNWKGPVPMGKESEYSLLYKGFGLHLLFFPFRLLDCKSKVPTKKKFSKRNSVTLETRLGLGDRRNQN